MAKHCNNNPKCPSCDVEMKKNGYTKNGAQRYKCTSCNKTTSVSDEKYKYERMSKRVLSALLSMLENDFWNKENKDEALEKAFKDTKKYYKRAKDISFKVQDDFEVEKNKNKIKIDCFKPKLLVCQDGKDIMFIQIPPYHELTEKERKCWDKTRLIYVISDYKADD